MRMKALIAGALTALCLSSCTSVPSFSDRVRAEKTLAMLDPGIKTDASLIEAFKYSNVLIIKDGPGGMLEGMFETLVYLDQHPEKLIIIDGDCYSACTLLLSRGANVAFTENAMFGFHSAYIVEGPRFIELSQSGNDRMLAQFPDKVKLWIINNDAYGSRDFTFMDSDLARRYFPKMFMSSKLLPKMVVGPTQRIKTR